MLRILAERLMLMCASIKMFCPPANEYFLLANTERSVQGGSHGSIRQPHPLLIIRLYSLVHYNLIFNLTTHVPLSGQTRRNLEGYSYLNIVKLKRLRSIQFELSGGRLETHGLGSISSSRCNELSQVLHHSRRERWKSPAGRSSTRIEFTFVVH